MAQRKEAGFAKGDRNLAETAKALSHPALCGRRPGPEYPCGRHIKGCRSLLLQKTK